MLYFSKTTGGFYDSAIHGDDIPADAVEITAEEHAAVFAAQSIGKRITAGEDGKPIAIDPPAPSDEELAVVKRLERDAALAATDGAVQCHRDEVDMGGKTTLTVDQFGALLAYRKALRDLPTQKGFPKVDLPAAPF